MKGKEEGKTEGRGNLQTVLGSGVCEGRGGRKEGGEKNSRQLCSSEKVLAGCMRLP
jgi:hypothetical protein